MSSEFISRFEHGSLQVFGQPHTGVLKGTETEAYGCDHVLLFGRNQQADSADDLKTTFLGLTSGLEIIQNHPVSMVIKRKQNHFPLTITECSDRCGYRSKLCFSNLDPRKIGDARHLNTLRSSTFQLGDYRLGHQHPFVVTTKQRQLSDTEEIE